MSSSCSMKRSRCDVELSVADLHQRRKRQKSNPSLLFQHSFLIPLLLQYLSDVDVLKALLSVDHDIRYDLEGYCLKHQVKQCDLLKVADVNRICPVRVTSIWQITLLPVVIATDPNSSSVKAIKFDDTFNAPIASGSLPISLRKLTFGWKFNQSIATGVLPASITQLTFGYDFNQPLVPGSIPLTVTHLSFGSRFNHPIPAGVIPTSVTNLDFNCDFDQPIQAGCIPQSVTCLKFSGRFNQPIPIGSIPTSVSNLQFGYSFNHPLSVERMAIKTSCFRRHIFR